MLKFTVWQAACPMRGKCQSGDIPWKCWPRSIWFHQTLGCPVGSEQMVGKWVFNLFINGVYWGYNYNPFTNH